MKGGKKTRREGSRVGGEISSQNPSPVKVANTVSLDMS